MTGKMVAIITITTRSKTMKASIKIAIIIAILLLSYPAY
ncbi:hypothetical protein AO369_0337 [Moraxella catarrhalis]|nr:hypothetical protein AO369_0337 [Moraxella catarrhalis]